MLKTIIGKLERKKKTLKLERLQRFVLKMFWIGLDSGAK